jgi:rod shape-determining protein MreC
MNKGILLFFAIFIALLGGAIYYSSTIQSPFLSLSGAVQNSYFNTVKYVSDSIDEHFNQQQHIQELQKQLKDYNENHLLMQQLSSELNSIYKESNNSFLRTDPKIELVRTVSYVKFSDVNKLWLEMKDFNSSKIYGLIYKDTVAGIAVPYGTKPIALLNGDVKCAYAVYIGQNSAPGIARGNNDGTVVVNFVPSWMPIKVGDEVVSSGLDNLFFKGMKVGKVISIKTSQGYQTAVVNPYYKSKEPRYFYLIKEVL